MNTFTRSLLAGLAFCLAGQAWSVPLNFSFSGTFARDNDVQLFGFTSDGVSAVTLRSYSYAGGVQADGNVVVRGGFDPILALFDSTGAFIAQQDDDPNDNAICDGNADPLTGMCWDTYFTTVLGAGDYVVAIMQYNNFANGPNLANGFVHDANPNFTAGWCANAAFCDVSGVVPWNNRTNAWAFDILNVEHAIQVPAPGTLLLGLSSLIGLLLRRRFGKD